MASSNVLNRSTDRPTGYPLGSLRYDLAVVLAGVWFISGLYLDGWAHSQPNLVDTFFTPWHLVLYSGFLTQALIIGGLQVVNMFRGYRLFQALPRGYALSLLGIIIFALGAPFDFVWHAWFGFESNTEALLSPAHLILAMGGLLIGSGPIRAFLHRNQQQKQRGWREFGPSVIAMALIVATLMFFLMYGFMIENPELMLVRARGSDAFYLGQTRLLFAILPIAVMMPLALVIMRLVQLPLGSWTIIFGLGHGLLFAARIRTSQGFEALLAAHIITWMLVDGFMWWQRPSLTRVRALRNFSFGFPLLYLLTGYAVMLAYGMTWKIHMWLGISIIMAGYGLFLSYVAVPSPLLQPQPTDDRS